MYINLSLSFLCFPSLKKDESSINIMFEIKLNHNSNTLVVRAVSMYSFKLYSERELSKKRFLKSIFDTRINLARPGITSDISLEKLNKSFFLSLPYGKYYVKNRGQSVIIVRELLGDSQATEGRIIINENIVLMTEVSFEVLINFLKDAMDYYKDHILNRKNDEKSVSCWIFNDGGWEKLNSHTQRKMATIYLEKKKKDVILKDIRKFKEKKTLKRYLELGIRYKRNYLFSGYPGTGKSSLSYAIASELEMDIAIISFGPTVTDVSLAKALKYIPKNTILLLEDIDALFKERKSDDFKNMISFSGLLNCLDGILFKEGLVTIMTTNYKKRLDPALHRPGRVDYVMDFGYSTENEIRMMYNMYYPDKKEMFDKFYSRIKTTDLTMAFVQEYFLSHMDGKHLVKDVKQLKESASKVKYSESLVALYS